MNGTHPFSRLLPHILHFSELHAEQLVLLLGIIMFAGALGGILFKKLRIPQVVGYIAVGIVLGSSGLQILGSGTIDALSPVNTIALSLIGFLVGAELKLSVIKKYGRQFIGILCGETITPFFVVGILTTLIAFSFTHDFRRSLALGLLLGAISSATAPAATTDVLKEFRTRGPLTTTVLGLVAMDDAGALILYAIASTVAAPLVGGHSVPFHMQVLNICIDIFGSVAVGICFGFIINLAIKKRMNNEGRVLSLALGGLFLSTGVCQLLSLNNILASMFIGFFLVNFANSKTHAVFTLVDAYTPPVYVLFFVLVGAKLNIWVVTPAVAFIAIAYVLGRSAGKTIGSKLGAWLTNAPSSVQRYLPWCLLSQAGVAIGLSIAASNDFPDSIGPQIILIITATTFIVQLVGPICVKYGVEKAGEVGLNVTEDDILKSSTVNDVTLGGERICSVQSPTIVNETDSLEKLLDTFGSQRYQTFAVVGADRKLSGVISLEHLKQILRMENLSHSLLAMDIMDSPECSCKPDMSLPDVYKQFSEFDAESIPIVDNENRSLGMLEKNTVDHYLHMRILELKRKLDSLE